MENALVILCGGDSSRMGSEFLGDYQCHSRRDRNLDYKSAQCPDTGISKSFPEIRIFLKNIFIRKAEGHLFPSAFKRTGDFRYLPECRSFSRCVQHFVHDR